MGSLTKHNKFSHLTASLSQPGIASDENISKQKIPHQGTDVVVSGAREQSPPTAIDWQVGLTPRSSPAGSHTTIGGSKKHMLGHTSGPSNGVAWGGGTRCRMSGPLEGRAASLWRTASSRAQQRRCAVCQISSSRTAVVAVR